MTLLGSSMISKMCSQMPIAEIVWFIMPERLANPTVRVIVQRTKLVSSPIESSPSLTSSPPKQRMLRMRKLAKRVITSSITPQNMCFFLPTSNTFFNNAEQLLLSMCSLEKERTTLIFPKTSVANEVAKARLFEYYFCNFLINFMIIRSTKEMMGVSTMIKRVSFQVMTHRKIKLPKNCRKFRISIERLSEHTEYTVAISLPRRESSSPVLVLSQQDISFSMILSNSSCLIAT